jgi:Ca-activated chloride channel family protein
VARRTRARSAGKIALAVALLSLSLTPRAARAQVEVVARTPQGQQAELPLGEERVDVVVDQQFAETTLRQVFVSESDARLEARYLVRAGEGARVLGFAYYIGERRIVGEVFEREVAQRIYEQVTGLGRDPGLLEQVGEGAFAFRIFPVEPRERKRVELRIGRWLAREGRGVEYRLPLGRADAAVSVQVRDDRRILGVTSPTHALAVERIGPGELRIHATPNAMPAKEVALRWELDEAPWSLSASVHRDRGHDGYLSASIVVPADIAAGSVSAKDVTLVLDRSGSMSGAPLEHARAAALRIVDRLDERDRINVLAFDDGVDALFAAPRSLAGAEGQATRREARRFLDGIRDGGGTDIAKALERALASQGGDDRPRLVLLLTDGQSSAQDVLATAKKDTADVRVYTVGIGSGVDKSLLAHLARLKRGRFTFIESAEVIEARVARLHEQLAAPVLIDPVLAVEGVRLASVYPARLPDLYRGEELRISARVAGEGNARIVLRGRIGGREVSFEKTVAVPAESRRPWAGRLWAQARVEDVLERIALEGENEERKNEVIQLATAYNFVTPYTAFLAIPESEVTAEAKDALESARDRKRRILAAHKDAAALSRQLMPPGDPVIRVQAPADARQVTAHFPFGLVLDLVHDRALGDWVGRFLVPRDVPDGDYDVRVLVVRADGGVDVATVRYTIDAREPGIQVDAIVGPDGVRVGVTTDEAARRVSVALVADVTVRSDLVDTGSGRRFEGLLRLPPGRHALRVVAADRARNESERIVEIEVPSATGQPASPP